MPGHIAKLTGPDPDPSPWLIVSPELKIKLKAKPYDPKKSVWVPTKDGGYLEGMIESEEGKKVTVKIGDESKVYKKDQIDQVNPPKFDCSDDMADLTYLGNPCVLWNSIVRYINELIYTYSGLFCIAINPYVRYPIYTLRTMELYVGKRRNECPPGLTRLYLSLGMRGGMKRRVGTSPLPLSCGWNKIPAEMNHSFTAVLGAVIS